MGPTTDRWLPILAIALIAGSAVGFFLTPSEPVILQQVSSVLAAALGAVTLVRSLRPDPKPSSWATAGFGVFVLLAVLASNLVQTFWKFRSFAYAEFTYLSIPATLLMTCGATLFWAVALTRRDHPDHEGLARLGRIGAGIAQLGFLFAFLQEIPSFRYMASSGMAGSGNPWGVLTSVLRLVIRVLLLWGSIEMMRGGSDPEQLRLRFARVHRILLAWLVLLALILAPIFLQRSARSPSDAAFYVWRNLLYCLVIPASAFLLARRFRVLPLGKAVPA
jgi:hypothetical protein